MKFIYIANARIPTEKAHGIQIMKMCEAFADSGVEVELVLPRRFNFIKDNLFKYYGIKKNFKIKKLPCLDLIPLAKYLGKLIFWIQSFSFACSSFWYVLLKKADIIYSRDELPLFFLSFLKKNIVWEVHTARANFLAKRAAKKCKSIIAITQGLKDYYVKEYNLNSSKILVAPDGVDLEEFDISISKESARKKLNLPLDKKIILYTGHLYDENGVYDILKSSQYLSNCLFVFVGGTEDDVSKFKERALEFKNILVIGHRSHQEMPFWQKAADILVIYNSGRYAKETHYVSSLKLFEYMVSKRPIVSSDLPSSREILNENNTILVKPDNPKALANGIEQLLKNPELAVKIAYQAYQNVQNYTWQKRANNILRFILTR